MNKPESHSCLLCRRYPWAPTFPPEGLPAVQCSTQLPPRSWTQENARMANECKFFDGPGADQPAAAPAEKTPDNAGQGAGTPAADQNGAGQQSAGADGLTGDKGGNQGAGGADEAQLAMEAARADRDKLAKLTNADLLELASDPRRKIDPEKLKGKSGNAPTKAQLLAALCGE